MDRNFEFVECLVLQGLVALRKESVDRNANPGSTELTFPGVALRKESVDRNILSVVVYSYYNVALRKESVDRNLTLIISLAVLCVALRKESVDRNSDGVVSGSADYGRSPQGERG